MNQKQFAFIESAARELRRLADGGASVSGEALSWADGVIAGPPKVAPFRPSIRRAPIEAALRAAPAAGLTAPELCEITGLIPRLLSVTLSKMVQGGDVAMLKIPTRSRYFIDAAALEVGRPLIDAQEAARAPSRHAMASIKRDVRAARKAEKAAMPPKARKEPKAKPAVRVRAPLARASVPNAAPRGPAHLAGEPVITSATKITIAPPPPARVWRTNTHGSAA